MRGKHGRPAAHRRHGRPSAAPSSLVVAQTVNGELRVATPATETAPRRGATPGKAGVAATSALARLRAGGERWLARQDATLWLLVGVALVALLPRLYGINWDANNHLHPDEREIVFKSICLSLPGGQRANSCDPAYTGTNWFFSPLSPLNPHFFAYGSLPQYLLAGVAHGLAWLTHVTNGRFAPSGGGAWDDFDHFTLVGRALSALFDAGSALLAGLLGRRLVSRWGGLLAAAFVAVTPLDVQLAHFYAVDTLLLFFALLTLLACVQLAQGGVAHADGENRSWGGWGAGLFVGAAFGLAMATKISAAPLLAPMGVALLLRWRRRGLEEALLAVFGMGGAALLAFVLTSPYTLIDWQTFQRQVTEQTMLSQGKLDYPYVRQFAGTQPFVYQLEQLLLYDMGAPLGALGLAGFGWAVARLWRRLDDDWAIIVVWLVGYFAVVGSAYMKFSRYMLPVFAPLAICAAGLLVALAAWGTQRLVAGGAEPTRDAARGLVARTQARLAVATGWATRLWGARWWNALCVGAGLMTLAVTLVLSLALLNIYSAPNTRVRASVWIYDHVAAGSTLTYEVWDDPLPIVAPATRTDAHGVGFTPDGHVINPYQYQQVGLNLYDDDTMSKAQALAGQLASAQVVVISSQRLLRSIPKLPDRYPMTTRYYQMLFGGQLGFRLGAHFEDHPHLLGVTLNDTGADESFSVYDHPPVWIFVRDGAGLNQADLLARLTNGVYLPATATHSGAEKPLLLSAQNAAADARSAPLGAQFPADSVANSIPLLWWLVVVELLGAISFPLAYIVFPGLRDRGWGLSKTLGLLTLAYLVWAPASVRLLPFERWTVVGALGALAALGGLIVWRRAGALQAFLRERWRLLVVCELAFVGAFLLFAWIRALNPDLWHIYRGGEKPMELAFLNAILRSRYMPPYDPWFSGGAINYYYYGQYLIAVLIKLTGVTPTVAFNLAIPMLFGLCFSGAFSVVTGLTGRWWAGLAAGFGLVVVGNFDAFSQVIKQYGALLAHQTAAPFDYWASSRVIPYTINEFPFWSFLYADLHAHVIDLPIVVLLIGACASLAQVGLQRHGRDASGAQGEAQGEARGEGRRWLALTPTLLAVALALGAAWCVSTWDVPTYAVLFLVALLLPLFFGSTAAELAGDVAETGWLALLRERLAWRTVRWYALALALTLGATYALYLPFHANYQNFVSGTGPVTTPTDPNQFMILFGLWLFLVISFFVVEAYDRVERYTRANPDALPVGPRARLWLVVFGCGLPLALAYQLGMKVFLVALLVFGLYLVSDRPALRDAPIRLFTYALLLLGLAIALGVEFIYVRDFLDHSPWERMNTVFKFYYQVWTLLALGGALAFSLLITRALPRAPTTDAMGEMSVAPANAEAASRRALRWVWVVVLVALVGASSLFALDGTAARVADPAVWAAVQPPPAGLQPAGLSLDGMAYMRGWYPSDYEAINWMNAHIAGNPVIVEASDGNYQWYGRVSIYTGLPDVLGWGSREYEQRYGAEVFPRQDDVQNFWSTGDPNAASRFLRQYQVRYIYVGLLERTCYININNQCVPLAAPALAKFETMRQAGVLRVAHQNGDVVIYEVTGS